MVTVWFNLTRGLNYDVYSRYQIGKMCEYTRLPHAVFTVVSLKSTWCWWSIISSEWLQGLLECTQFYIIDYFYYLIHSGFYVVYVTCGVVCDALTVRNDSILKFERNTVLLFVCTFPKWDFGEEME